MLFATYNGMITMNKPKTAHDHSTTSDLGAGISGEKLDDPTTVGVDGAVNCNTTLHHNDPEYQNQPNQQQCFPGIGSIPKCINPYTDSLMTAQAGRPFTCNNTPSCSSEVGHESVVSMVGKDSDLLFAQRAARLCLICGDVARGKNYGVFSCDSCKGFFSRTIKKQLKYSCREGKRCHIDKALRSRCQYCRFQKCISVGMKIDDLMKPKQLGKDDNDVYGTLERLNIENLVIAEQKLSYQVCPIEDRNMDKVVGNVLQGADNQLKRLVKWAKKLPYFKDMSQDDQKALLRSAWTEIVILGFCFRSMSVEDGILLSTGVFVHKSTAHKAGEGEIFDRILNELVGCMKRLNMDLAELACLRSIILYNPNALGIVNTERVQHIHNLLHDELEKYCQDIHPDQSGRYSKLILRLPALRSIKLKCMETMFFMKSCGPPSNSVMLAMMDMIDKDEVE